MMATVCRGFLKPGSRVKAAIPSIMVNGSMCSLLSCTNGSGAVQNPRQRVERDFTKAAMDCVGKFTLSGSSLSLIRKLTLFFTKI